MIALAIATHIPMADWIEAGDEAIATAVEILAEQQDRIEEASRNG